MDKKENAQKWYQKFEHLFQELPDYDTPLWEAKQRDRWVTAFEGMLGLYIPVEDDDDDYYFDDQMPF